MRFALILLLLFSACRSSSENKGKSEPAESMGSATSEIMIDAAPQGESAGQQPVRLPGVMEPAPWLKEATRVVAYGGRDNAVIVAGGNGWLRWFDASGKMLGEREGVGGAQVLEVADLKGDGTLEILFARGMARGAADAPAVLEVLTLGEKVKAQVLPLPESPRGQVVAVVPVPGAKNTIWVASFVSKFEVEVNRFERSDAGEWSVAETRGRHRVVGDMSVLPDGTPVIARMYGDDADSEGGVYALTSADASSALPSTRGARAILTLPGPEASVAMADGWHKEYGKKARGLVTIATRSGGEWSGGAQVNVKNNYGFSQLRLGDVHREPGAEIVASGNGHAVVMLPTRPDLLFELADAVAADAYPIDLSGDERMEVVIAGPKPSIWSAR
jgi:hypothetical protein